jgi:hypothetical protein
MAGSIFWVAACGSVLLVLIPALREWNHPQGQFSGLAVISLLAIVAGLTVVIAIVAVIRTPMAYGVGLALVSVPVLWFAVGVSVRLLRGETREEIPRLVIDLFQLSDAAFDAVIHWRPTIADLNNCRISSAFMRRFRHIDHEASNTIPHTSTIAVTGISSQSPAS